MQTLKNSSGQPIGYIREQGTRQVLVSTSGNPLGYYDRNTNATTRPNGAVVGYGNLLTTLIHG